MRTLILFSVFCFQLSAFGQGFWTPRIGGTNLVAWWTFDNDGRGIAGGVNFTNASPNSNYLSAGVIGNAYQTGTNLVTSSDALVNLTNSQYSISIWLKHGVFSVGKLEIILESSPFYGTSRNAFLIDANEFVTNAISFGVSQPAGFLIKSSGAINDSLWHHFVAVMDTNLSGTNQMTLYFDGGINQINSTYTMSQSNLVPNVLYLGSRFNSSYFYNGTTDDIRIYNRAITAEEIKSLYNNGRGTQQ